MPSQKSVQVPVLLVYLLLPPLLCSNLHCYYSPYITKETKDLFKLVVSECPPGQLCFKATGFYGKNDALTHHGCTLQKDCNRARMVTVKGVEYNTNYSCCDWSYCNTAPGMSANFAHVLIVLLSLIFVIWP